MKITEQTLFELPESTKQPPFQVDLRMDPNDPRRGMIPASWRSRDKGKRFYSLMAMGELGADAVRRALNFLDAHYDCDTFIDGSMKFYFNLDPDSYFLCLRALMHKEFTDG